MSAENELSYSILNLCGEGPKEIFKSLEKNVVKLTMHNSHLSFNETALNIYTYIAKCSCTFLYACIQMYLYMHLASHWLLVTTGQLTSHQSLVTSAQPTNCDNHLYCFLVNRDVCNSKYIQHQINVNEFSSFGSQKFTLIFVDNCLR